MNELFLNGFIGLYIIVLLFSYADQQFYRPDKVCGDCDALLDVLLRHIEEAVVVTFLAKPLEAVVETTVIYGQQTGLDIMQTEQGMGCLMAACL